MDEFRNPYRPGAGAPPPILTGREREIQSIETLIGRLSRGMGERSVVFTGLRGVGKTALLGVAERSAEQIGWIAQSVEARPGRDFHEAVADRAWVVLRHLESKGVVREALTRLSGLIRRVGMRDPGTGLEMSIELGPRERAIDFETNLVDLFRALGEAARDAGTGVLFLLDELQQAKSEPLEALCAAMHELSKRQLPLAIVAAGLPPLRLSLLESKTYAERLFTYRELGPLSPEAATAALVEPARAPNDGLDFEPAALDVLLRACAGYPYFIQVYGHAAWNVAEPPSLDSKEVTEAIRLGRRELDADLYAGRWERASERARRYMRAMAERSDTVVASGDVAAVLGGHAAVSVVREQLIAEGLIYSPERGQVAFTVPGFADFIRRTQTAQPSTA
jgi:AAA ATPase-like protein